MLENPYFEGVQHDPGNPLGHLFFALWAAAFVYCCIRGYMREEPEDDE